MDATLRPFSLPLRRPLVTSSGTIERREGVLVRVEEDGYVGIGEATPLPGWTEPVETCTGALEDARMRLAADGPDPALTSLAETPAARHGLSLALADLDARRAGRPLYRHLANGERVESVPANATVGDGPVDETVSAARDAVEAGFSCVKLKVGVRSVAADAGRLAAVRDALGGEVALRADANGAWSREEAGEAIETFADSDVEYIEEPLDSGDLPGLAELRCGPVGIAVDETLARVGLQAVVDHEAADVVVVKPMVLGGVDRALDVIRRVSAAGLRAVVSTTVDAAVARTAAVHLTAALDEPAPAGLATAALLADDVATDPAPVVDGRARVPRSSGHGVEVEGWSS